MRVLVLTPDTDIDRRIILQANTLANNGFKVTIIGVPYDGDNRLSGEVHPSIVVKRIQLQDVEYESRMVKRYKAIHKWIMKVAYRRNDLLNGFSNRNLSSSGGAGAKIKNKFVTAITRSVNYASTKLIGLAQKLTNVAYNGALWFFRKYNINFFPIFDNAFYKAGITEEADLVVANDLPSLRAGFMIATEKGIPLIYDAHENYTEQITLPKRYKNLLEKHEAEILPQVDEWIVPNPMLGQAVIEKYKQNYNVDIKKPIVIQNAVKYWDQYEKHSGNDLIRQTLKLDPKKKVLLYQGGIIPNRNLEKMILAMQHVKDNDIVLVLLGFGNYKFQLSEMAKKRSLENKVYFMDAVPQQKLLEYTCSADAGIIPYSAVDKNTFYCSPNKLYEFIQARLPIISNDLPFLRQMIVTNKVGSVGDFSKPEAIAGAIDSAMSNSELLGSYKRNIINLAEEVTWELEEAKLLSYYITKQPKSSVS